MVLGSGNLSLRELGNPPLSGSSLTNICHNDLVERLEKLVLETKQDKMDYMMCLKYLNNYYRQMVLYKNNWIILFLIMVDNMLSFSLI